MSTVYSAEHLHNGYSPATNNYTNGQDQPMDGRQPEYSQSGLSSPYQSYSGQHSEEPTVDHASAAHYSQTQDVKFNPGATPAPDYGLSTPTSRSGPFPDYMQQRAQYPDGSQRYHAQGAPGGSALNMVQPSSPSTPLDDGQSASHQDAQDVTSNTDVPLDPSIVGASPTYAQHHYSPYAQSHEMAHYQPAPPGMYGRAEYGAPYPGPHSHAMPSPYAHVPGGVPNAALMPAAQRPPGGGHPMSTVYSFVPIPGTHQQKRPRRRFEEIERMYKCGWNGCEKAYGTLNHLNAHVTMQAHGHKRTPEEFKEIRKEWKLRKKEEDTARKADDDRVRQQAPSQPGQLEGAPSSVENIQQQPSGYPQPVRQLPPIGYAPAGGQVAPQYAQAGHGMDGLPQYASASMSAYYPQSPYAQNQQSM